MDPNGTWKLYISDDGNEPQQSSSSGAGGSLESWGLRIHTTGGGSGPATSTEILVLGDSYSAGNGAGSYFGAAGCRRSSGNYAERLAGLIRTSGGTASVRNGACSGATTFDFGRGRDGRPPMLEHIRSSDDLIFLTAGGNDASFRQIVKKCLVAVARDGADCDKLLRNAETLISNGTLKRRLTTVLNSISSRASSTAEIILLGCPRLEGNPRYPLRSGRTGPIIRVGERL
jgi:lysophospholipase L1-like esterase